MTGEQLPRIRMLGSQPKADAAWTDLLDDVRFWRSIGAPYKAIADMVADDYGVRLDEDTLARILNDSPRQPGMAA